MIIRYYILILIIALLFSACSIRKHLPANTYLYNGAAVSVTATPDSSLKTRAVRKSLQGITFPKKNKMFLGIPYKVGWWYFIGEPKRESGLKYWLRNRLGEPPVLNTMVDMEANVDNIVAYLENRGYFKSKADSSSSVKGYKWKAHYNVKLRPPYFLDSIAWILDSSVLSKDILTIPPTDSYIKKGQQFELANIKAETRRVDLYLKQKGYYYFSPDYIKTYVDTTVGNHTIKLYLSIKKETPLVARLPQTINSIMVFPNYTLLTPPPDTTKTSVMLYDEVYIRDTVNAFTPEALLRSLTYGPESLYDVQIHNESLNRFINMGAFKFVKSRYEPSTDSINPSRMDVYYYLTPLNKKNIAAEVGGFTKSNSFTGAQASINWKNRNLFKGAEKLNIKTYGAFETSPNDSLKKNNNFRLGAEVSMSIPRLITSFNIADTGYYPPVTKFLLGFEWMRRQLLFTKNFIRGQYDLTWRRKTNRIHTLAPVSITYNNASQFSDEYLQKIIQFPVLEFSTRPELILGSFYNYTHTSTNPNAVNIYYFNGNVDLAGNIAGLFKKANAPFSKQIFGAYYAQYVKLDVDFRYTRKLAKDVYLANRIAIGAGMPYGNSAYLPFSKQFIIGGGNSLRGFRPKRLGPGTVFTTADQQVTYPQIGGDYKLEIQTELRFPLFGAVKGALFAEAGNIWMKNELLYGSEGTFSKNIFRELGVDVGAGIRVDAQVLIIRLDIGIPVHKPWLPLSERWQRIELTSRDYRRENFVYNIGIGYPF